MLVAWVLALVLVIVASMAFGGEYGVDYATPGSESKALGGFMSTLMLTGATGLVGSRLLPRMIEAGYDCRASRPAGRRSARAIPGRAVALRTSPTVMP